MQSFLSGNFESSKSRSLELKARAVSDRATDGAESLANDAANDVERALFIERLRREAKRHDPERHPFNLRMLEGHLSSEEIRLWVMNTYYYESRAPIARALVLEKMEESALRRRYLGGSANGSENGAHEDTLAAWERLAEATGVERAALRDGSGVLIGVRFACDAYASFLREASAAEAVVASLAEALTPELDARRLGAFVHRYSWIDPNALGCLRAGLETKHRADVLADLVGALASADVREACVAAVIKKSQILWHILDCLDAASRMKAM